MKTLTRITTSFCASLCFAASALGAEPPSPMQMQVRDVFACNFESGKDMDDLMDVAGDYAKHLDELGIDNIREFVWTPFRANISYDYLWFAYTPDLAAWANINETWSASAKAAGIDAKFAELGKCNTGLGTNEVVFDGGELAVTDPPALIQSWACNLRHGFSMEDVADLDDHIARAATESGMFSSNVVLKSVPIARSDTTRDVYYWSVHNDESVWAARTAWQAADPEGQLLQRHADNVLDCNTGLFKSTSVVPSPED